MHILLFACMDAQQQQQKVVRSIICYWSQQSQNSFCLYYFRCTCFQFQIHSPSFQSCILWCRTSPCYFLSFIRISFPHVWGYDASSKLVNSIYKTYKRQPWNECVYVGACQSLVIILLPIWLSHVSIWEYSSRKLLFFSISLFWLCVKDT